MGLVTVFVESRKGMVVMSGGRWDVKGKHRYTACNKYIMHLPPVEFQALTLSDSGDADTLGPLPPGGIWSSDGEYSVPPYDYFQNRSSQNTGSSKSPSPGGCGTTLLG